MESNESKLHIRLEGANRYLSTVMVSLTAVVVGVLEFKGYMASSVKSVRPKDAAGFLKLLYWILILSGFSSLATCTMCLNLNPSKKGRFRRTAISYFGLLAWNACFFIPFGLVIARGSDEDEGPDFDGRDWRNLGYALILLWVICGVNVGFLCFPCWWHMKKKEEARNEKLPEASVVNGACAQGVSSHPVEICENLPSIAESSESGEAGSRSTRSNTEFGISNGSMASSSQPLKERSLSRWDTAIFSMRWRDQSGPSGSTRINRKLEDTETPFYAKPMLRAGNFFYSLWDAVREEEGKFRYSIWILSAALISVLMLFLTMISLIIYVMTTTKKFETSATEVFSKQDEVIKKAGEQNMTVPEYLNDTIVGAIDKMQDALSMLENVNMQNPNIPGHANVTATIDSLKNLTDSDAFKLLGYLNTSLAHINDQYGTSVYGAPKYCSSFARVLYKSLPIGFTLGTAIGFLAIYNVLRSHKKMSLMFMEEIRQHAQHGQGDSDSWFGIEKKYPIGRAVYFLGVMTSTALAQQVIFSTIISLLITLIFNFDGYGYFMHLFGYKLLAVGATILLNRLIVVGFGNKFLSDGLHVKHVYLFFLYMCTFSMVHFVLGIYYALFRIIGMVITSLFVINRLDKTIFPVAGKFDNGHNAFMSMLVLTHAIQHDKQKTGAEGKSQKSRNTDDSTGVVSSDSQDRSVDEPLLGY